MLFTRWMVDTYTYEKSILRTETLLNAEKNGIILYGIIFLLQSYLRKIINPTKSNQFYFSITVCNITFLFWNISMQSLSICIYTFI